MKLIKIITIILLCGCTNNDTVSQIRYRQHNLLVIGIYGEVTNPGIYNIEKNKSFNDLVILASGYSKNAIKQQNIKLTKDNTYFINSNKIKDKINLNTASSKQLQSIKGIGPAMSKAIIDYKVEINNYKILIQLLEVKGIGEIVFSKIYHYLYI
ncbi:helix-hairpin-helix domain-containing protein [Mycoplasma sp. P36-A1]|uniref:helix-hairpin-helix domain-containing protein n=1 Tax=Mycoplasma sp. P36-A1 TaxID=3252900 RepID=UPI003C2EFFE1